jgi:hypothetical protein
MTTAARRFHQPRLLLENALRKDPKPCSPNRQNHTQPNLSEIARLLVFRRAASWHKAQGVHAHPETCLARPVFRKRFHVQHSYAVLNTRLTKLYRAGAWRHPPTALAHPYQTPPNIIRQQGQQVGTPATLQLILVAICSYPAAADPCGHMSSNFNPTLSIFTSFTPLILTLCLLHL